jgi:hypothetical protein
MATEDSEPEDEILQDQGDFKDAAAVARALEGVEGTTEIVKARASGRIVGI